MDDDDPSGLAGTSFLFEMGWIAIPYLAIGLALVVFFDAMDRRYNPGSIERDESIGIPPLMRWMGWALGTINWPLLVLALIWGTILAWNEEVKDRRRGWPPNRGLRWMRRLFAPPHKWPDWPPKVVK
jgi:hypothetical protein